MGRLFAGCAAALAAAGCGARTPRVANPSATVAPAKTASKAELITAYDKLAGSVRTLNAGVTMQVTAGSAYTGVIKQYHQVNGFVLAEKPNNIRVIGQLPVIGTTIFNMVSDGRTFSIFIPSKNQFLTGPARLERPSEKPVENLRPQHLMEAVFWTPIPEDDPVLFEQATDNGARDYVLTVVTPKASPGNGAAEDWEISRKIWFERAGLTLARIETYGPGGQVESDIQYGNWTAFGDVEYPKQITLARPADGYTLALMVTKLTANVPIEAQRFALEQPAGSELVRVGEPAGSTQN